jgi:hypothetical protein
MPKNGLNGLTDDQVHRIRTSGLPDEYFAKLYGQCKDSIGNARRGRTYKNHPTPPDVVGRSGGGRYARSDLTLRREAQHLEIETKDLALFQRLRAWTEIDPDGCWIWTGAYKSNRPYPSGQHGTVFVNGTGMGAHRAMWLAVNGEIPEGMCVCHTCDKPRCIHPHHLWLGTHAENMRDSKLKGRHAVTNKTHCKRNHPLPLPGIDGKRRCAECLRIAAREYQRRRRASEKGATS